MAFMSNVAEVVFDQARRAQKHLIQSNNAVLRGLAGGSKVDRAILRSHNARKGLEIQRARLAELQRDRKLAEQAKDAAKLQEIDEKIAMTQKRINAAVSGGGTDLRQMLNVAGAYISEDWVRAAALYGTGAVGLRLLSGGSLTVNNRGERDIVGVPFI